MTSRESKLSFRAKWVEFLQFQAGVSSSSCPDDKPARRWADDNSISNHQQFEAFVHLTGIPRSDDLREYTPASEFLKRFDISFARDHQVLVLQSTSGDFYSAICCFRGLGKIDLIQRQIGVESPPLVTSERLLREAINSGYESQATETQKFIDTFDDDEIRLSNDPAAGGDLLDATGQSPIVRIVNSLLFEAVKAGASDIHIQPSQDRVKVRQRIDGILFDSYEVPKHLQEQVLTRIKVLGRMDIAEKRMPQDGRATIHVGDREIDLRIATLPTSHNERIVIRLLDKSARLYHLDELGMPERVLDRYRELVRLDHGLLLVTGPTGSGKSTTLYASLLEVNTTDLNVLSIEDPIEYQLQGVSQTQINEKKGLTFAAGLRSVLRQDPDVVMVGEIRDDDTASMSVQASLTGHLVFSTLHTNDAASAITRLLDLGLESYLVSSSLVAVLAQRLVRRICANCISKDDSEATKRLCERLQLDNSYQPLRGQGCESCRHTGFRGRLGIFELLIANEKIRNLVQSRANAAEIRNLATSEGMKLLREDGIEKVYQGLTTVDEVTRVSGIVAES